MVSNDIREARTAARQTGMEAGGEAVRDTARRAADDLGNRDYDALRRELALLRSQIASLAGTGAEQAKDMAAAGAEKAMVGARQAVATAREHPWATLAIAGAVGAVVAIILYRSREDPWYTRRGLEQRGRRGWSRLSAAAPEVDTDTIVSQFERMADRLRSYIR